MKPANLLLVLAVLLGMGLRLSYLDPNLGRTPDEQTYTRQANVVLQQGSAGFALLGEELARDPATVGLHPSPLRVGYLVPLTLFMRLIDVNSVQAGVVFSLLCSVASLLLLGWAGRRFFGTTAAIAAVVFLAVLPFDLTVYRRAWEESYIGLLALASLTLALWLGRPGRRVGRGDAVGFLGLAALGVLSMTTKETSGLAFLAIVAGLALHFVRAGERRSAGKTVMCVCVAVMGYLVILGWLFGGIGHALWLTRQDMYYSGVNPYNAQWDAGTRWMFVEGLWRASPVVMVFALLGTSISAYRLWLKRAVGALRTNATLLGIAVLTAAMLALQMATERYSYRYAATVYAAGCLLAGIGVAEAASLLQRWSPKLRRVAASSALGFVVAIAAWRDLSFARTKLLETGMQDLALRMVLELGPLAPIPETVLAAGTPTNAAGRIDLALAYTNAGRPSQAVPLLDAVLAEDATNAVAWNDRCVAYTLLHAYAEAVHDCRQALAVQPDFPLAKNNLAWAEGEQAKAQH